MADLALELEGEEDTSEADQAKATKLAKKKAAIQRRVAAEEKKESKKKASNRNKKRDEDDDDLALDAFVNKPVKKKN